MRKQSYRALCAALVWLALASATAQAQTWRFRRGHAIPPQVCWLPAAAGDSYILYCGTSSATYTQSDDVGLGVDGCVKLADTSLSLTPGTQYYCALRTVLDSLESDDSNEICFVWNGANRKTGQCS